MSTPLEQPSNMDNVLISALAETHNEFQKDELAYLAITCKVEHPFRDRLAFQLHRRLGENALVSREWKRVDLAILNDKGEPLALVEAKAMYTFDALLKPDYFINLTAKDEAKAARLAKSETEIYSLLLATHIHASVQLNLMNIAKYSRQVNKWLSGYPTHAEMMQKATTATKDRLANRNVLVERCMDAGAAFCLQVSILYWLTKSNKVVTT